MWVIYCLTAIYIYKPQSLTALATQAKLIQSWLRGDKFCITPLNELAIMSVFELNRELGLSHANDKSGVCIVFGARVYALHVIADAKQISREPSAS
jgi:hypothetical protein